MKTWKKIGLGILGVGAGYYAGAKFLPYWPFVLPGANDLGLNSIVNVKGKPGEWVVLGVAALDGKKAYGLIDKATAKNGLNVHPWEISNIVSKTGAPLLHA